jgi:rubredoxin
MALRKFKCRVCDHVYEEALGTRFEDLPDDWVCPECGATKADFEELVCA